ncbi:MAG: T9SS type A sorting domain-containing protein [Crocinitomicaceae bacterium]|jgi:aminopeptidase N|nr:T9SS type A sorting domain-containing protein [Crocinitomicaceae bacterium]
MTFARSIFLMSLFVLQSAIAQESATHCSKKDRRILQSKSATLNLAQIAETEKYDVHFYQLDLNMTNVSTYLNGTGSIHATTKTALDSALFELFPTLNITEIRLNDVPVGFSRMGSAVKVPINLSANQSFKIDVDYEGNPPTAQTNPLGGSGMTAGSSPSWGNKVVWSLSEPFSAFEWFPCKQSLTDKADSCAVSITVPDTCKAGSNGILEHITPLGNGQTKYDWKHRHPIDYYLISVAVAKYIEYNVYANPIGAPNPILIQNYIYDNPATLPNFQSEIDETADFLELFYERYGPYPFEDEKYGHCMAPISGGMEHQTMTSQGFFEKTLTAHELAHQWWGNNVTCASWCDIWMNEGFASYSEYIMLENLYPGQQGPSMQQVHNNVMSQAGGSVWVLDSLNESRIFSGRLTYDKGAGIIHTLRFIINNDDLFFNGLRAFQQAFKDSTSTGIAFKEFMENYTGISLNDFFNEWYFGEGYPTYSLKWNQSGQDVAIEISHTTSKPSITPTFTNPLAIRFARQGQADTVVRFDIHSNQDQFSIYNLGQLTGSINIDPSNWIMNQIGTISQDPNVNVGFAAISASKEIQIYPNPSQGNVQVKNLPNGLHEMDVLTTSGQLIYTKNVTNSEHIRLNDLNAGTYILHIRLNTNEQKNMLLQISEH